MGLTHSSIIRSVMGAVILSGALNACGVTPAAKVEHKSDLDLSVKVQSLQKQIQERDRRIEELDKRIQELESQLEALKLIDEDHEKQRKPLRPPTTVEPTH